MDELLKDVETLGDLSGAFTLLDVSLVLFLSFVLSMVVAAVYRYTHRGVSYSQSYVHTLVIMGTVVSFIMLVVGSNVARAFSLVGSLTIIRFRTAVKETRDVGCLFMSMAIGMACGTRSYLLAVFATAVFSAVLVVLYKFNLFAKEVRERILRIELPVDRNHETAFEDPFRKYLEEFRLISVETVRVNVLQEVVYSVVLKRRAQPGELIEALRKKNDNNKVTLVLGLQEIDI